jgi:hypothetical protein
MQDKIEEKRMEKYSKQDLCNILSEQHWSVVSDSVQSYCDLMENNILEVVDNLVPIRVCDKNFAPKSSLPQFIKTKMKNR